MKINLLIIYFAFFLAMISHAQTNQKGFSDTTLWHMHSGFVWLEGPGGTLHEENFNTYRMVIGDTVIQDTVYQLLFNCNSFFSTSSISLLGYFKTINNTVFYGRSPDSMKMIYNYNLSTGDTFRFNSYCNFYDSTSYLVKVVNTDSILINNRYRKRILFEDFPDTNNFCNTNIAPCWVEGMGDYNYGLIFDYGVILYCACQVSGNSGLQCFSENNISIVGDCHTSADAVINNPAKTKLIVFPNPGSEKITVRSQDDKIICFKLLNATGQLIISKRCFTSQLDVNINSIKPGFYFFNIKTENNLSRYGKLIIK